MKFLESINNDTIIVCSNDNKKKILKKINEYRKLFSIKFLTLNELYNLYYFDYDKKTIYYVMNEYNVKYEVAKTYLDSLIYLDKDSYQNEKLSNLLNIKKFVLDNNLLIKSNSFIHNIKNKDIIFFGFDYIDNFTTKLINSLNKITNVKVIDKQYKDNKHYVIETSHIEEEVDIVASKICKLIHEGIDINKIKITNIDEEYIPVIKRIFFYYKIPINLNSSNSLYSTLPASYLIKNYNSDLNDVIEYLKDNYNYNIVNQIINIINDYTFVDDKILVKDMIIHDLINTKIKEVKLLNAVEIIDYKNASDNDYIFMLNFNQKSIPIIYKNENYLTDNECKILGLETSIEKNKIEKNIAINNIKSINNLIITYKKTSYSKEYYPSNLIDIMNLEVKHEDSLLKYSNLSNKIKLCSYLDDYYKYNIKNKDLELLFSNYEIPYRTYSNKYKKINKETLHKIINNELSLSYSSMQAYNECSFKYFIQNILKLDVYEDKFSAYIGTLFHHILEIGIKKEIDVKKEILSFVSNKEFTNKEKFYIEKLTNEIEFALKTIKNQMNYTKFNKIITENKLTVLKGNDIKVIFKGFIDKMMVYEYDNKTLVSLIDYKTSDIDLKMNLIDYGLNLQLPIYLYLASNSLSNVVFAGFYIQKVLSTDKKYDESTSLEDKKISNMKLCGYSNSDQDILKLFDRSYKSSEIIKNLKLTNDNEFSKSSNVLSNSEMKDIIDKVDKLIDKCVNNIESCNFDINPKSINNKNIGCNYCKYKDICYMTANDIDEIVIQEDTIDEMD